MSRGVVGEWGRVSGNNTLETLDFTKGEARENKGS